MQTLPGPTLSSSLFKVLSGRVLGLQDQGRIPGSQEEGQSRHWGGGEIEAVCHTATKDSLYTVSSQHETASINDESSVS